MNDQIANRSHSPNALASTTGGEMGERTLAFDWSTTSLGPIGAWPQSLKTAVRIMLDSRYAMWLGWGPDLTFFYNDAYAKMTLGPKHPWALGRPAREVWPEIWSDIGPRAEKVFATGEATWDEGLLLFLERQGFREETYHTFSYSPIPDDDGSIGGMLCVVTEDTERTIAERRLRTLRELAARTTAAAKSVEDACQSAASTLADNPHDLPFALIYLLDADSGTAYLAGSAGVPEGSEAAQPVIALAEAGRHSRGWPLGAVLDSGQAEVIRGLETRFGPLSCRPWPEPPRQAVIVPMARPGQARPAGFVVAGVSPRLAFDDAYKGFMDLLAGHVATAVANSRAYEEEKRRAEALAELDRAKTAFFSNVSHEFRTPLTLMLGPVEDLLSRDRHSLAPSTAAQLEIVNRNGMRLLRLVNTLLDFSRIEAGRVRASFQPTDLAAYTAGLASVFQSAIERAGLRLLVDCPALDEPVFVDPEMWEKIVLNLLSNAFKFTFEGEIAVSLSRAGTNAVLRVRDTGTGIPPEEMPRLFERFHRVNNAQARTHEGSGIGLALVLELVKLHGGNISAESELGKGTTFIVSLPLGHLHLPSDQIGNGRGAHSAEAAANPFVEEALRWLPDIANRDREPLIDQDPPPAADRRSRNDEPFELPRVLLAEDNADMRQYVARLLSEGHVVTAVPDGAAALEAARERVPDLVLSDVMMPRLDGFGLLRELRADARTRNVPVILLSARAGEESRVEGMEAGADDYMVKPFGARELLARVSAHLQMARMRREASETLRASEERLRLALSAARMVAWEYDPVADQFTASDNFAEVYGLPPGYIVDRSERGFSLVHPEDLERQHRAAWKAIEEGSGYETQFRIIRPDNGAVVWLEERAKAVQGGSGQPLRLVGVSVDVSDRERAEEALRLSHARFEALVKNAPLGIYLVDAELRIRQVNPRARPIFGNIDEPIGSDFAQVVHRLWQPRFADEIVERFKRTLETGEPYVVPEQMEERLDRGPNEYYEWQIHRILFPDGQYGVVCYFSDISRHVLARQALSASERALQEADRRKDEYLATLAHELRNPLAPISNAVQIVRAKSPKIPELLWARDVIDRQVGHMARLLDDLLDVSRISRDKLELKKDRVSLASIVESAIETSRPVIDGGQHELSVSLPKEPVCLDADPLRLAQVLANLLNNAAKYTDPGGRIELIAHREGDMVLVSVRDNGIGIAPQVLPGLFEMFSQATPALERSQGGLGIGLALVKGLVEMHGGTVFARSDGPGAGSEFVVRLPVAAADTQPERERPSAVAPAQSARVKIVVADDNQDAADSLALLLNMLGNEVRSARDGQEAIEVAEAFRPDLMLLDIGMPRLNGYEACRRIRESPWGKNVLIVAVTGWGQDEDRRKAETAGFDSHIVKPIDPAALDKLLKSRVAAAH